MKKKITLKDILILQAAATPHYHLISSSSTAPNSSYWRFTPFFGSR